MDWMDYGMEYVGLGIAFMFFLLLTVAVGFACYGLFYVITHG